MSSKHIKNVKVYIMKRNILILFLIFIGIMNLGAFGKPKKIKCNKPIYFFENVKKTDYFNYLDKIIEQGGYDLKKFYPELGFISINYEVKYNKPEVVGLNLKQFGNDVYLFIDISKSDTKLENYIYSNLKQYSKNSYLLRNDYFCKELTKDINLINTRRKNHLKDSEFNPTLYKLDLKRYIGFDKKTYFHFFKKKENKQNKL